MPSFKKNFAAALVSGVALLSIAACDAPVAQTKSDDSFVDQAAPGPDLEVNIPFEQFTLDNGLRVVVHEDRKAPIVAVSVWYHVGSKDEPEGKSGFAHLFEHLMFNGSENYDDEWFGPMEKVGATGLNGTTSSDRTNYFENVPTPALDMALWMESDRMGHLLGAVTQAKLDEQRGVVQNEKRQGDNAPFGLTRYRVLEGLYPPGHPYRHSTIGSMADLNAASLEDVKSWFKQYYGAANTVIVLAGDIDVATAKEKMQKYFGDIAAGPALKHHKAWVPTRTENTLEEMVDEKAPNERLVRAWAVAPRTQEDAHLLKLASRVLTGGKNSRLYQELVYKEQIATSVSAYVNDQELASEMRFTVNMKPGVPASKAEPILNRVLAEFLAEGPTVEELVRAKTGVLSGRVAGLEQVGGFGGKAVTLAQGALYAGDPGFYAQELNWIKSATTGDIRDAAQTWMKKGYYQLISKPQGKYKVAESTVDRSTGLPAVTADLPQLKLPEIQETTLSNGLKLVLATRDTVPFVYTNLSFDAGDASGLGRPSGVPGYTVDMMDEGTASRTGLEISGDLQDLGAGFGASSGFDRTTMTLSVLKPNLKPALAIMGDIIRNPAFPEKEMERLRKQKLARIAQEKAQPIGLGLRLFPDLIYGEGHSYAGPYSGSGDEQSIANMAIDDLKAWHKDYIRPDNATLFIVGDITMDEAKPLLEEVYGDWQAPETPVPAKNIAEVALPDAPRIVIVDKPGTPQSIILAAHLLPGSGSDDTLAINTANEVLGGSFTARVNMNLREDKGWSYGARTLAFEAQGQRLWLGYAPVQTDKTAESVAEMLKEYNGIIGDNPPTQAELDRIKSNNLNSLPGQFETASAVLGSIVGNAGNGRPLNDAENLKGYYDALDLAKVQATAKQYFKPNSLTWLVIGDRSKIEEGLTALNLGEILYFDSEGNQTE